jgi:hypothetical protein
MKIVVIVLFSVLLNASNLKCKSTSVNADVDTCTQKLFMFTKSDWKFDSISNLHIVGVDFENDLLNHKFLNCIPNLDTTQINKVLGKNHKTSIINLSDNKRGTTYTYKIKCTKTLPVNNLHFVSYPILIVNFNEVGKVIVIGIDNFAYDK